MEILNAIINILFLLITFGFLCLYVVSLILNIVRASKALNKLKKNPKTIKATVTEVVQEKSNVHIKFKYVSPENRQLFNDMITLSKSAFKDQYYVDQEIELIYPDTKDQKRVYYFPRFINDQKRRIEAGPLFTDILICLAGAGIFGYTLVAMIILPDSWTGKIALIDSNSSFFGAQDTSEPTGIFNMFTLIIMLVIYFMLFSYVLERLISASVEHTHNYLKLCGVMTTAKVVTYKFGRSKDAKGNKEAQLKIEFYDNGELIQTNLNSHLYSETEEEYIKILYDPKHPKTTVYMR